jgi:acyl phosphate:glycerol-3-phosphate acyltransferase
MVIGYILGGVPSGLWVGRARGVDLTALGSRNIGATNAFRVLGPLWGAVVFLLDAAKGYLAVALGTALARSAGAADPGHPGPVYAGIVAGVAAILGHVFTPWLRFRGGRGVATSLGVFLAIIPWPTLLAFALWILLVAATRRVSVGSIGAALAYPFLAFALLRSAPNRTLLTAVSTLVAALVILRHRANIGRLLSGSEPPIFGGGKGPA